MSTFKKKPQKYQSNKTPTSTHFCSLRNLSSTQPQNKNYFWMQVFPNKRETEEIRKVTYNSIIFPHFRHK